MLYRWHGFAHPNHVLSVGESPRKADIEGLQAGITQIMSRYSELQLAFDGGFACIFKYKWEEPGPRHLIMIARSKYSRRDVHVAVEILPISNEKDIKGSEI